MTNKNSTLLRALFILLVLWLSACQGVSAATPEPTADDYQPPTLTVSPRSTAAPSQPYPARKATDTPTTPEAKDADPTNALTNTPTVTQTQVIQETTMTPPPEQRVFVPAGKVVAPILLYHRIRNDGNTRYIITTDTFREQMEALKTEGYQTISLELLAKAIREGADLPPKPVILTFDDGFLDVYENAFPILKELGFTGVTYVITGTLGTDKKYGYMQEPELKALAAAGWEIGSHSITHTNLKESKQGIGNEIQKSRDELEEKLGVKVLSFAYPYGITNPWIEDLVQKSGYDTAVGLGLPISHNAKRLYYLSRREVERGMTLAEFKALLTPGEADRYVGGSETATPTP